MVTILLDPWFNWAKHDLWSRTLNIVGELAPRATIHEGTQYSAYHLTNGSPKERQQSLGEQFPTLVSEIIASEEYRSFKLAAIGMMRRDNTFGLHREVDAEIVLLDIIVHWVIELRASKPSLVLFSVTPHFIESFVLYFVAQNAGIATLFFQPCSLVSRMLPRSSLSKKVTLEAEEFSPFHGFCKEEERLFNDSLARMTTNEHPKYIERQKRLASDALTARGRFRAIYWTFRWMFKPRFEDRTGWNPVPGLGRILTNAIQVVVPRQLRKLLERSFKENSRHYSPRGDYALFALHYEPERTSNPETFPAISQTENVILTMSILGEMLQLVVLEHPSQLSTSLQGYRGRSRFFFPFIAKRLGLHLPNLQENASLLAESKIVITGTGNIGIEAAFRGKPVIYFGHPWWEGMPGTYPASQVMNRKFQLESLTGARKGEIEEFLRVRCGSEMIPGGASETSSALTRRFGSLRPQFSDHTSEKVAQFIAKYLDKAFPESEA